MRDYTEDSMHMGSSNEHAIAKTFGRMQNTMKKHSMDPFRNAAEICGNTEYMGLITEAAKLSKDDVPTNASVYALEDIGRLNTLYENVGASILNEAVESTANLSPIIINSFGIQERALISTHLPRAVKQVTAKLDNFKLTERMPFIVDLAGNKTKFIDAFLPGSTLSGNLKEKKVFEVTVPSTDVDLYTTLSVSTERIFGYDSTVESFDIVDPEAAVAETLCTADTIAILVDSIRQPEPETGAFKVGVEYTDTDAVKHKAIISGQFNLADGKLVYITTSDPNVKTVTFSMILSPETHHNALSVGYDTKHTTVQIPIGEHLEYSISEEFKDAADKYYNIDAMSLLTDYMGRAVEQIKDLNTLAKFQELGESAMFKGTFSCTPTAGFAQGTEEYIRREFHPYVEKVCIILKNKTRIPNCHFRVVGNPMDIRVPAAAGTEYIYKRNEQFMGDITLDYEFSLTSDVHKIFYLSSERVPQGKLFVFLIPNTIENNISTVNHYEYATYVSNKYRGTKSNLPTVMISTRYLTKEYFPVVATIAISGNTPAIEE